MKSSLQKKSVQLRAILDSKMYIVTVPLTSVELDIWMKFSRAEKQTNIIDKLCSNRPMMAVTEDNMGSSKRTTLITACELFDELSIRKPSVRTIIKELDYRKVCA